MEEGDRGKFLGLGGGRSKKKDMHSYRFYLQILNGELKRVVDIICHTVCAFY